MQRMKARQWSAVNGELSTISVTLMTVPARTVGVLMARRSILPPRRVHAVLPIR